ncbi:hypothetical protein ACA910_012128 [Epithemia clementina (nom. ined.)]
MALREIEQVSDHHTPGAPPFRRPDQENAGFVHSTSGDSGTGFRQEGQISLTDSDELKRLNSEKDDYSISGDSNNNDEFRWSDHGGFRGREGDEFRRDPGFRGGGGSVEAAGRGQSPAGIDHFRRDMPFGRNRRGSDFREPGGPPGVVFGRGPGGRSAGRAHSCQRTGGSRSPVKYCW